LPALTASGLMIENVFSMSCLSITLRIRAFGGVVAPPRLLVS
jgi:hypothetical protein